MNDNEIKVAVDKYIERSIKNILNATFTSNKGNKRFEIVNVFKVNNLFYCAAKEILENESLSDTIELRGLFLSPERSTIRFIIGEKEFEDVKAEYQRLYLND